jgi:cysteine desulfurase
MNSPIIYLDSAASYPVLPEVKECLITEFNNTYANAASSHILGQEASAKVEAVREMLAEDIGAYPSEIVFTSGATESNNIALKCSAILNNSCKRHIVTTQIEHKCILSITKYLKSIGYSITYVKPDANGVISAQSISDAIREDTAIVSVMHVNNELGTINPIEEIGQVCFKRGVLFHSDAAQSYKKIEIDVDNMNVDFMSFSAHKIGGPKGIGAIYIRDLRIKNLTPIIHGAGQEFGLRGGTLATPLIAGFGKAIEKFSSHYDNFCRLDIKKVLITNLKQLGINFFINGKNSLPNCISITFPNTDTETFLRANENRFCLSQGSACSSKEVEPSHVLTSIGLSRELADKTFRISFPLDISAAQVRIFCNEIKKFSTHL